MARRCSWSCTRSPPRICCWLSARAVPWEAGYWHLKEKGYRAWFALHESAEGSKAFVDWETRRREVQQKLAALVAGIRSAEFPVYSLDEKCTGICPFHTVCRINQVRSLEKTWP